MGSLMRGWRRRLLLSALVPIAIQVAATTSAGATPVPLVTSSGVAEQVNEDGVAMTVKTEAPAAPPTSPETLLGVCKVSISGMCAVTGPNLTGFESAQVTAAHTASQCDGGQCGVANCYGHPSGPNCNYQDPAEFGCENDAGKGGPSYTDAEWDATDKTFMQVWLRWSHHCQSNWAKVAWSGDPTYLTSVVGYNNTHDDNSATWNYDNESYGYMLYGGPGTQCVQAWGSVDGGGSTGTDWVKTGCV